MVTSRLTSNCRSMVVFLSGFLGDFCGLAGFARNGEAGIQDRRRAVKGRGAAGFDKGGRGQYLKRRAQVAELVDALVSGTSGASREGSSPFLGTTLRFQLRVAQPFNSEACPA